MARMNTLELPRMRAVVLGIGKGPEREMAPGLFLVASLPTLDAGGRGATRKKLVATGSRRERVYKRTGEPSVTFCERGGAAE